MRLLENPKAQLRQKITVAALSLEALDERDGLRIAGQRIIGLARQTAKTLPDELPPALNIAERKEMSHLGKSLIQIGQQLSQIWLKKMKATKYPAWMRRKRNLSEAAYFQQLLGELESLDYDVRHALYQKYSQAEIQQLHASWLLLNERQQLRQANLKLIQMSSVLSSTLANIASLVRLAESDLTG